MPKHNCLYSLQHSSGVPIGGMNMSRVKNTLPVQFSNRFLDDLQGFVF